MRALLVPLLGVVMVLSLPGVSLDDGKDAFGRRDWKAAVDLLGRFVEASPDDPQAPTGAFLRAVALYEVGDFRGSLDGFQKLERTWPQSSFAHRLPYWKGTAALAAGQLTLAERELLAQTRYPDEQPYTTRAWLNLALARISLKESDAAIEALKTFTQTTHEADLASQAWALWGDEDRKAGRHDEALAHYRLGWEAHPGDRWDLWSRTQALDLLLSLGRFAEAKALLDGSRNLFPQETDRWDSRRIDVDRGLGDRDDLIRVLEIRWTRETDPGKKQALAANRARVSEEAGHGDSVWWLRASAGPDDVLGAQAILRYAFLLEGQSKGADAAVALETWGRTHPLAAPEGRETVQSRAAQDRWSAGDLAGARKGWSRLITDFPRSSHLTGWLFSRGRAALSAGDTEAALGDFSRIVREFPQAPEGPEARYQTGLVYLQRQEPVRAEPWFYGLVTELKSGDLYQRALLARGISYVDSGQTDLARASLQRLIREAPTGPWVASSWAALGRNALQARLFDEAVEAWTQAEAGQTDPAEKAKDLWSLAEARAAQGKPAEAANAYARYADDPQRPRASEALYRRGAVWFAAREWQQALDAWSPVAPSLKGDVLAETREGLALAFLQLGRIQEGWDQLEVLEKVVPSPEAWYRWGQAATALGQTDWGVKAFQTLLERHPDAPVAEAALPRAAGALLGSGKTDEALARYGDYFKKFGRQPASAPVARAAAAAALPFPAILEALVKASRSWNLAPEVETEFSLAWAQSRLDSDSAAAQAELQGLSKMAPWTSQRSEALGILGRWDLARGHLVEARAALEAASDLGDDLSMFKARWALAQVTDQEGDRISGARQREAAEKQAGPGVPLEFRLQLLKEASAGWTQVGRPEDASRVQKRIEALSP